MFGTQRSNSLLKSTAKHIKNTKLTPPHANLCKINIVSALLSVNLVTLLLDNSLAFQWLRLTKLSPACPPEIPLSQLSFRLWVCVHRSHSPKTPRYKQLRTLPIRAAQAGRTQDSSLRTSWTAVSLSSLSVLWSSWQPWGTAWWAYDLHLWVSENAIRFVLFTSGDTHVNSVVLSMDR